ncbi:hypothetical protein DRQ53_04020 [bacterium]|nr:MAG: hypothetical protein DRQ53_04020 [bacterium]
MHLKSTLIIALLTPALLSACGDGGQVGPQQTYAVDGVITRLPAGPGTELMVEHEAIPDFVNAAGDTIGMKAMTMGFPTAEHVDLTGLAAGDSVSIRFVVRWGQPHPLELTQIERH